jgi:hypothetical protein
LQNPFTERAVPITGLAGEVRAPPEPEPDRYELRAQRILETKNEKAFRARNPEGLSTIPIWNGAVLELRDPLAMPDVVFRQPAAA